MYKYPTGCSMAREPQSVRATSRWCLLAVGLWMGTGSSAFAEPPLLTNPPLAPNPPVTANPTLTTDSPITRDSPSNVDWFIADQFTYDNNLYRLPVYLDVTTVAGPQARREDGFNSTTLGGNGRWFPTARHLASIFAPMRIASSTTIHWTTSRVRATSRGIGGWRL